MGKDNNNENENKELIKKLKELFKDKEIDDEDFKSMKKVNAKKKIT